MSSPRGKRITRSIACAAACCLSLLVSPTGITVSGVTAAPGWTFNVKRDQPDQIDVLWTNVANPALTHEYRRSQNSVRVS